MYNGSTSIRWHFPYCSRPLILVVILGLLLTLPAIYQYSVTRHRAHQAEDRLVLAQQEYESVSGQLQGNAFCFEILIFLNIIYILGTRSPRYYT